MDFVARKLEMFASPGDTIVDFSCGSNKFLPIFKRDCLKQGKVVLGRAFDTIFPRIDMDFEPTTWIDVPPGALTVLQSMNAAEVLSATLSCAHSWKQLPQAEASLLLDCLDMAHACKTVVLESSCF